MTTASAAVCRRQPDNGEDWPLLRPLLADAALKPGAEAIRWTRDAFLDLLRIAREFGAVSTAQRG